MLTTEVRVGLIVCIVASAVVGLVAFAWWHFQTKDQEYNAGFDNMGPLMAGFASGGCFMVLITVLAIAVTIRGCL